MRHILFVFFSFTLLLFHPQSGRSQESIGLTYGSYNGISVSKLNPSFLLNSKNNWEVQIIGAHTFLDNSYGSVYQSNLLHTINNNESINVPLRPYDDVSNAESLDIIFNRSNKKTHLDYKGDINSLGGFFKINTNTVIGITTGVRSSITAHNVPSSLNYYNIKDLEVDSVFNLNQFQANGMIWTEYGLHYAQQIDEKVKVGISAKYLNGYKSFAIDNNVEIDYVETADTLSALDSGQARFAFSDIEEEEFKVNGRGISLSLGAELLNENGSYIGVSIVDLGWMSMTGKNYLVNYEEGQSIIYGDYDPVETLNQQIAQMLVDGFQIDSTESTTMVLPTAFSLQYRVSINKRFSIQGHLMQNLRFSDQQIKRSNSTTVSGIYDSKHFSAFLPITLYDYKSLRVGAAIRLGFLTIGSDKLFSVFTTQDNFNGSDLYVNLKFYPFKIGKDEGDKINCFSF